MEKIKLSDRGQLTIPQYILNIYQWKKNTEFMLLDTGGEIVIKPVSEIPPSELESPDTPSVYKGKPLSLEDMERVISIESGKHK